MEEHVSVDPFDEIMIANYLSIPSVLRSLERYKRNLKTEFYSRNMATHIEYSLAGVRTKAFRADNEVIDYLSRLELVDKRIDRFIFRNRQFHRYWDSLSDDEQKQLISRFRERKPIEVSQHLIGQTIDELYEIETAICFREGIEPEETERMELTDDPGENLERMCDFFAI